jgi:hypothetical protein
MKKFSKKYLIFMMSIFIIGCTTTKSLIPEPIIAKNSAEALMRNNINDKELLSYLERYDLNLPTKDEYWSSDLLIMVALFNNKKLEMMRAEHGLIASDVQVIKAGFKNKIISPTLEYHNKGKPFSIGLSIELPINKISIKETKLDLAKIKTLTKAVEIILPAWEIRTNVIKATTEVLKYEEEYKQELIITNKMRENLIIMNGLYEQGIISSIIYNSKKKEIDERISNLKVIQSQIKAARINLASILNLPIELLLNLKISLDEEKYSSLEELESLLDHNLNIALVSRGDVLTALSKYAESEAELRLIVAEENKIIQTISPAIFWDQTDLIFNLSGSLLLKNEDIINAKINRAVKKRDVYKANFEVTQNLVLKEVYTSYSKMLIVNAEYYAALSLLENAKLSLEIMLKRNINGDVSKLEVLQSELLVLTREKLLLDIKYNRLISFLEFENSLGHSYYDKASLPKDAYYPIDYFTNSYKGNY